MTFNRYIDYTHTLYIYERDSPYINMYVIHTDDIYIYKA